LFELGKHPSGGDDVADPGWAGGDALQRAPAASEQGEAAFTEGALATLKRVVGQVVGCERMSRVPWNFGGGPVIIRRL
jgi:hypothetical protein